MNLTQIKELLSTWQPSFFGQIQSKPKIIWSLPTSLEHGILTTNIAFIIAKEIKQNPNQIATKLSEELQSFLEEKKLKLQAKAVGAYINLGFEERFYTEHINSKLEKENLIKPSYEKLIFDYIGANVAKRLHIGHMRNCNIGDSLRRILSLKYLNLVTDNHWGDWGVNMGILIWGWKNFDHTAFEKDIELIDKLSQIYVWANEQKDNVENWNQKVRHEFYLLEQKDPENAKLWQEFIQVTKKDLQQDLSLLNVPPLQLEQGESYYEPDMFWLTEILDRHNIWLKEGNARYFDFEDLTTNWKGLDENQAKKISKLGRAYLISSQGYTSYIYRDVAARLQWARDHQASLMLTITDKTQKHNFDQAFAIICYLAQSPEFQGELQRYLEEKKPLHAEFKKQFEQETSQVLEKLKAENLKHLGYGFLKLPDGKMSSRKGNVILLRDLFEQVVDAAKVALVQKAGESKSFDEKTLQTKATKIAAAALKWNDLKQFYEQDITFDINQVLKFEGNTGVYQLYTYARLNSVLQKLLDKSLPSLRAEHVNPESDNETVKGLNKEPDNVNQIEKLILTQHFALPEILEQICTKLEPHLLTNYLYELCILLNKWYNDVPILKDEKRQKFLEIFLQKNLEILQFALDLLGIETLDSL
jgi:arginyl-tRNA synthetase